MLCIIRVIPVLRVSRDVREKLFRCRRTPEIVAAIIAGVILVSRDRVTFE